MKKPTSVSLDPQCWQEFVSRTTSEGRKASSVVRALIADYISGSYSPYKNKPLDWEAQADIAYKLEELRA